MKKTCTVTGLKIMGAMWQAIHVASRTKEQPPDDNQKETGDLHATNSANLILPAARMKQKSHPGQHPDFSRETLIRESHMPC